MTTDKRREEAEKWVHKVLSQRQTAIHNDDIDGIKATTAALAYTKLRADERDAMVLIASNTSEHPATITRTVAPGESLYLRSGGSIEKVDPSVGDGFPPADPLSMVLAERDAAVAECERLRAAIESAAALLPVGPCPQSSECHECKAAEILRAALNDKEQGK